MVYMSLLRIALCIPASLAAANLNAADVYGSATTAQSIALGGIYLNSPGPTDALAANPALLTSIGRPYLELTGMGVLAGGEFHNATPTVGHLESNAGFAGSAGFGMQVPHTRLSLGVGVFPVSLLSDRWIYQDPAGTAGASYGLQNNKSAFLAIQSAFGLGFQISRNISVGASLGVVDNLNTLDTAYIFQTNPTLASLKTLLRLHTTGIGYNGTFGLIARPTRRLDIGIAYKTQTTVRSTGNARGDAYAQFAALGLAYPSSFHYRAEVDNVFPQSASLSAAFQLRPRVQTFLQADWLNWRSAFT